MDANLLIALTKRDFVDRYSGSIFGVGWAFISPLVNILIYTLIFSQVMNARLPGVTGGWSYSIYLVSGLIPWLAFSNTVARASTVFLDQKHIITKVNISLLRLPVFIVLSETITFVITMGIFLVFYLLSGNSLCWALLVLPFIYLIQQIFAFSIGFIIAQLAVFIRDLKELTGICLQLMFWFTPIVYVVSIVPQGLASLITYSPVYQFINVWQSVFVYHTIPDLTGVMVVAVLAHVLLALGFLMYRALEKDIRDFL